MFQTRSKHSPVKVFRELRVSCIVLDHLVEIIIIVIVITIIIIIIIIIILILIIIIFSTEGAFRLPTTYDKHPSNQTHPIQSVRHMALNQLNRPLRLI